MSTVFFRVDAALHIGSGHVMRCLTLADELKQQGANCHFICREFEGNLCDFITQKGYQIHLLPVIKNVSFPYKEQHIPHEHWLGASWMDDANLTCNVLKSVGEKINWLIVDHYALDFQWEKQIRSFVEKVMAIDDLADRKHDCDVLLDQTYGREKNEYAHLLPTNSRLLLGPHYALLRNEFNAIREHAFKKRNALVPVKNIMISMGGMDEHNCTGFILSSLCSSSLLQHCDFTVIVGKNFKQLQEIKDLKDKFPYKLTIKVGVSNIAELMLESDLCIGASGTTVWERCVLGLPSLIIATAENQLKIANDLAKLGVHWLIGKWDQLNSEQIQCMVEHAVIDKNACYVLSTRSFPVCDGLGVHRVVKELLKSEIEFIPVSEKHATLLYEWRNSEEVRRYSFNTDKISLETHKKWIQEKIHSGNVKLLLAQVNSVPIGCVRFDFKSTDVAEMSIYLSPDVLGKGFGKEILFVAQDWIRTHYPQIKYIDAQIREENKASQRIFKQANFKRYSSHYRYNIV